MEENSTPPNEILRQLPDSATGQPHESRHISNLNERGDAVEKMPVHKPFVVAVEGNIGAGKSTMINYFRGFDDVQIHPEPIGKW